MFVIYANQTTNGLAAQVAVLLFNGLKGVP
jgi:hypothetical protein